MFHMFADTMAEEDPVEFLVSFIKINSHKLSQKQKETIHSFRKTVPQTTDLVNLSYVKLGNEGIFHFSKIYFPCLKHLHLWGCEFQSLGMLEISKMSLPHIESLFLGKNLFGLEGIQIIMNEPQFQNLKDIRFGKNSTYPERNRMGKEGIQLFARAQWKKLETLFIGINDIGDEGARAISNKNWPSLSCLMLTHNKITRKGLISILCSALPSQLNKLILTESLAGQTIDIDIER